MAGVSRVLIYLIRRDLRLADNPIFHELAQLQQQSQRPFTHVLPVFVFSADQVEVSGFLRSGHKSPYPEARSRVSGLWRCGRLRAKFTAESVWDLKEDLQSIGSRLEVRVGSITDIVQSLLDGYKKSDDAEVHGLWMTGDEPWEEREQEKAARKVMEKDGKEFKLWVDEKYLVDDRDLPFDDAKDLSDVFTTFRKTVEPLREAPRRQLPRPDRIPPPPDFIPPQAGPFEVPDSLAGLIQALHNPIAADLEIPHMPDMPERVESAHPFVGGSKPGHARVHHLIGSGAMSAYKDTRNGLLGLDFSTRLSAWLALGCLTARQVHWYLVDCEDARTDLGRHAAGHGHGENPGTAAVRFELLWRDYMRLCTRKFGRRLFDAGGYRHDPDARQRVRRSPSTASPDPPTPPPAPRATVERFFRGETGTGLIDASQRELFLTGWTSNRARQNVASYLTKHLGLDWRLGAEWYEANLVDYDASSNWGNWQYVAGVGNDPRGDARVFNPVKQAVDYDPQGDYVRAWVPELRAVRGEGPEALMGVFQAWRLPGEEKRRLGLEGVEWVERPLVRIRFDVHRRGGGGGGKRGRGGTRGRGGGRGGWRN